MPLEPEALVAAAQEEAGGFTAFGPGPWREGLEVFCRSLNDESGMGEAGMAAAGAMIVNALAERLRIEDWLARRPEILAQRLATPVNILGMPRSGTTALQQFLSMDPQMRSIRRWELTTPTPPPDDAVGEADPRVAATRAAFEERDRRTPAWRSMLPVEAEDPSEHNAPMNFTFLNLQCLTLYDVPSCQTWMLGQDLTGGYEYLERVLKLLQWKTPRPRWNLKNPMDLFCLPAFVRVFPETKLVWLHRDPANVLASACSLIATVRESMAQQVDRRRFGPRMLDLLSEEVRRGMRDRDAEALAIVDIYNRDLARDPPRAIAALYERLGLVFTAAFEQALRSRLQARPRGQFGRHVYALEDFGLTTAEVRARFRDYTDRFDIPLEA